MTDHQVYFIQAKETGLVKIGRSLDAQKRLRQLQTGSPHELSLVGQIICSPEIGLETKLHRLYAQNRIRENGEWFNVDPREGLSMAEQIVKNHVPPVIVHRHDRGNDAFKTWTPEEVEELVSLAQRKGIKKPELAAEFIGCDQSYISHVLAGRKTPTDLARAAMSWAEHRIKKLKDRS